MKTHKKNKGQPENMAGMRETAYLTLNPYNAIKLKESFNQEKAAKILIGCQEEIKATFTANSWHEYLEWSEKEKAILQVINNLIIQIKENPLETIKKSIILENTLKGKLSLSITSLNRLVFEAKEDGKGLIIFQCKYNYFHN